MAAASNAVEQQCLGSSTLPVRLEDEANSRQCLLVLMGATADGQKELIAVEEGYRESKQSWMEMLLSLKQRGVAIAPKLAIGDGALGFWAALRECFPETREQRCWVHKTANVLNHLPKSVQPKAKADLHEIWQAETRECANKAFDHFLEKYQAKYQAACECLRKDRDVLLTFYDFPAEHWGHLRTTNPIESTFATIRLRHRRTKGNGTRKAGASPAEKSFRGGRALAVPFYIGKGRGHRGGEEFPRRMRVSRSIVPATGASPVERNRSTCDIRLVIGRGRRDFAHARVGHE